MQKNTNDYSERIREKIESMNNKLTNWVDNRTVERIMWPKQ